MTSFRPLQKAILSKEQLEAFQASSTYASITSYVEALNNAVVSVKLTDECAASQGIIALLEMLDRVEALARETPPVDNATSRFGNPAFKTFYDKVQQVGACKTPSLCFMLMAIPEVSGYFVESWGNRTRIDYGSGMELNFLCWLLCLERLGVVHESDHVALVIRVFWRYVQVMRTLQSTYWLEPAWFTRNHKHLRPKSIHDNEVVEEFSKDYIYFRVKTASLRWHSPMLDDISAVKTWDKVNQGMIKMYHAEVLGKLPVIQHFLFGSILPYEGPVVPISAGHQDDGHGHSHGDASDAHAGWHDPCGIPVPSAFAAAAEEQKRGGTRLGGPGVRPVPFD
ncbi:Phosphotyrosyl phosphatase activator [Lactarius hatsudake]|nr:Phosphotyrosyl phosphatase activator [Lactarius hatsudake]